MAQVTITITDQEDGTVSLTTTPTLDWLGQRSNQKDFRLSNAQNYGVALMNRALEISKGERKGFFKKLMGA